MLRAGYTGSFFHNDETTVTFDNPFRVTDIAATPSRGRNSLPPSNSFVSVNGMASVKMPARSRATAYVSMGQLKDAGDPLMPQTINSANTTAPLERDRVNGEARTSAVNLTFVSRPTRYADVNVRYRSYDYDNRTPAFTMTPAGRVRQRAVGRDATAVHTEPFGVLRHTLDADFRVTALRFATAGIGYSRLAGRAHAPHLRVDDRQRRPGDLRLGRQCAGSRCEPSSSTRSGAARASRRASSSWPRSASSPGMRHFDVAPRDRNRVTVLGSVTPNGVLSFNASVAAGKDDYRLELPQTRIAPEDLFGLRDNMHLVGTFGLDAAPNDRVTFGASYSYEHYNALQPLAPGQPWRGVHRSHTKLVGRRHRPRALGDPDHRRQQDRREGRPAVQLRLQPRPRALRVHRRRGPQSHAAGGDRHHDNAAAAGQRCRW